MRRLRNLLVIGVGGALLIATVLFAYLMRQIQWPATGCPAEFARGGRAALSQRVVVCLGASIVHGRVSVDFVELLRRRFAGRNFTFVNAGVNADPSFCALARLDSVVACDPDFVVVLVGTNDVQATLSPRVKRLLVRGKHLPVEPSQESYRENMTAIVERLQRETRASVALAALPVLGEDLASEANARVRAFNAVLQQIAEAHGAAYLPVHERQADYLRRHGADHGRPFNGSPFRVMAAAAEHFLLGQSLDAVSARRGFRLTTEGIHLNSVGAGFVVDLVADFLGDGA